MRWCFWECELSKLYEFNVSCLVTFWRAFLRDGSGWIKVKSLFISLAAHDNINFEALTFPPWNDEGIVARWKMEISLSARIKIIFKHFSLRQAFWEVKLLIQISITTSRMKKKAHSEGLILNCWIVLSHHLPFTVSSQLSYNKNCFQFNSAFCWLAVCSPARVSVEFVFG